jgi:hypothetical protein
MREKGKKKKKREEEAGKKNRAMEREKVCLIN